MSLAFILQLSCILTFVVMFLFILGILIVMRFGQEWVSNIVERFMNPDKKKDNKKEDNERVATPQPQVASSQSLRQRAQNLDFPAPAAGFSSQVAPQQDTFGQNQAYGQQAPRASLRSRDEYSGFNPQATGQSQSFQANMPSLSPSRPFQTGGLQPSQSQYPQQGQFPPAPQQGGLQPLRPQQAPQQGFQQQNFQQPQQGQFPPPQPGLQPLRPQQAPQQGFQQQNFQQPQQGQFPPPQAPQSGLGDYRPQLNNSPRPDLRTQGQQTPYRRDSRRQEEDEGFLGGLIDDAGDMLGGF